MYQPLLALNQFPQQNESKLPECSLNRRNNKFKTAENSNFGRVDKSLKKSIEE